jgi:hypothetical protein
MTASEGGSDPLAHESTLDPLMLPVRNPKQALRAKPPSYSYNAGTAG